MPRVSASGLLAENIGSAGNNVMVIRLNKYGTVVQVGLRLNKYVAVVYRVNTFLYFLADVKQLTLWCSRQMRDCLMLVSS